MVGRYGSDNMIYYYCVGTVIFCVISLLFYYLAPDIGRYVYWQGDGLFQSTRLKGIGGNEKHFVENSPLLCCDVVEFTADDVEIIKDWIYPGSQWNILSNINQ